MKALARKAGLALSIAALMAALPSTAGAGILVKSAPSCSAQTLSKPFTPWDDTNNYTLVPGGGFEPGMASWALSGGAKLVSGNEPYYVRSATDSRSLYLPQGATATSPPMCVGIDHPSIRWLSRQSGTLLNLTGSMTVEVLFEDALGNVLSAPVGAGLLSTSWQPSVPGLVSASLLPLLPGQMTPVEFRLRAVTANWNVDDAYVDPYARW